MEEIGNIDLGDNPYKTFERNKLKNVYNKEFTAIKQVLIKTQELEKENAYIEKIKTMMKQKDCILRYIESEDCFGVKTILSDGWYKLTPEFVENNIREEIKPLPLIEKNKQLKAENDEYKKVLEIIKEKEVDIHLLKACITCYTDSLNAYNSEIKKLYYKHKDYQNKSLSFYLLTQEEFDLLKRWSGYQKN